MGPWQLWKGLSLTTGKTCVHPAHWQDICTNSQPFVSYLSSLLCCCCKSWVCWSWTWQNVRKLPKAKLTSWTAGGDRKQSVSWSSMALRPGTAFSRVDLQRRANWIKYQWSLRTHFNGLNFFVNIISTKSLIVQAALLNGKHNFQPRIIFLYIFYHYLYITNTQESIKNLLRTFQLTHSHFSLFK